ncbi:mitochondrial dimethyladenosine transferase 1-like isoform X2 [Dysidea avara]|uniref:mitochondrial dimethyladenosine transferase 1-like isoform X2 n=1 Tax=Dysidea avara TaxID=196820 RepID=UPI00331E3901
MVTPRAAKVVTSLAGRSWGNRSFKPILQNKDAAGRIVKCLDKEALDRVIVETNPGFGVVTSALLNAGAADVRVLEYHGNQTSWKSNFEELRSDFPGQLHLFNCSLEGLDLGKAKKLTYDRVLHGVPKKDWTDKDSPGYLVSTFNNKYDFKTMFHLLNNCRWQRGLFRWGRFTIIAVCIQQLAQKLTATTSGASTMTIAAQLNCHVESLFKIPSSDFSVGSRNQKCFNHDYDVLKLEPRIKQPFVGCEAFSDSMLLNLTKCKAKTLHITLKNYHPKPKELLEKLSIPNKQVRNATSEELQRIIVECFEVQ